MYKRLLVSLMAMSLVACSGGGSGSGDASGDDSISIGGDDDKRSPTWPDNQGGDPDGPTPIFPDTTEDPDVPVDEDKGPDPLIDIGELPPKPDVTGDDNTIEPLDVQEPDIGDPPLVLEYAEPGIKILGPSATGKGQSLGAFIQVAGIVAGSPDGITWESKTTGETGYAQGDPFWLTGKIDLEVGDNRIEVTAVQGQYVATDTIVVTYNPAFMFGSDLNSRPRGMFTNTETDLVFNIDMGMYANFEPGTLMLCESTAEGICLSDIHAMMDDGQPDITGDEVPEDSIFSWRKTYTIGQPGKLCFRAHVLVKSGYMQYTAFSPVTCVDVVDYLSQEECQNMVALQQNAVQLYNDTFASSGDVNTARQAVIASLAEQPEVAELGSSYAGMGVWLRYANGILGAFNFNPGDARGGGGEGETEQAFGAIGANEIPIASKRSIVLSPHHDELGALDESVFADGLLKKSVCPTFVLDGPYKNTQATLARFRSLHEYGVIAIAGHGDSYFRSLSLGAKAGYNWSHRYSHELIWTGEPMDCSKLVQSSPSCTGPGSCPEGSQCVVTGAQTVGTSLTGICIDYKQLDLRTGRAVMGHDRYGIVPSFFKHYRGNGFPDSLVYLGTCRSLWNGTLGMELFGAGVKTIAGYSGYVTSEFAHERGTDFFVGVVEQGLVTGETMPEDPVEDPVYPGTSLHLMGAPNLTVTDSSLINPSWETGNLTGWQSTGDGRVITRLGVSMPVEGKFMGVISTGMGYTPQTGEIYQTFCIPADNTQMSFYWKFASEEFKEWCGTMFQDTFEATIEGSEGAITLVDATVDTLCPPEECETCGDMYDGLIQCDFVLDQGGCWMTHWRKSETDVSALAGGGAVTLRYFNTDIGDSIYDSVVLLDTIKFK